MKTGLTLEQLAAEITRQQSAKEDYVVNTGNLRLESYGPDLTLRVMDSDGADRIEPLEIGDIAHRQIGTHLSIPAKYYERMRSEDPGLLAHNVNTWLERTPAQRMIRVLDGKARAYLQKPLRFILQHMQCICAKPVYDQLGGLAANALDKP